MTQTATYHAFFDDLIREMGWEPSSAVLNGLALVSCIEGPNDPAAPPTRYNPLNSEVRYGSSENWNDVGVQDYISYEQGLLGTKALLQGAHWTHLRQEMRLASLTYEQALEAWAAAYTWARPNWHAISATQRSERLARVIGSKPGSTPVSTPPADGAPFHNYTVVSGDTLWSISEALYHNGADYTRIAKANQLVKPYTIRPHEVLRIPS